MDIEVRLETLKHFRLSFYSRFSGLIAGMVIALVWVTNETRKQTRRVIYVVDNSRNFAGAVATWFYRPRRWRAHSHIAGNRRDCFGD